MAIGDSVEKGFNRRAKRRWSFNLSRSRLPLIIIVLLVIYISFSLGSRLEQLYNMQKKIEAMQDEIEDLRSKNAALYDELEKLKSNDYIEQVAREKLGLVKPGEARIVPVPQDAQDAQDAQDTQEAQEVQEAQP